MRPHCILLEEMEVYIYLTDVAVNDTFLFFILQDNLQQ